MTPPTGITTRERVRELAYQGVPFLEISARLQLSVSALEYHMQRLDEPGRRRMGGRRNQNSDQVAKWCECGTAKHGTASRCQRCVLADRRRRISLLIQHATRTGVVPTVTEAAQIVGLKRSRAGDLVKEAFGPDPRNGAARRAERRRYP